MRSYLGAKGSEVDGVAVTIQPTLSSTGILTLSYPGHQDVSINIDNVSADQGAMKQECEIWGEMAHGLDCGDQVAEWLTKVILGEDSTKLRLVFHKDKSTSRPVKEDK